MPPESESLWWDFFKNSLNCLCKEQVQYFCLFEHAVREKDGGRLALNVKNRLTFVVLFSLTMACCLATCPCFARKQTVWRTQRPPTSSRHFFKTLKFGNFEHFTDWKKKKKRKKIVFVWTPPQILRPRVAVVSDHLQQSLLPKTAQAPQRSCTCMLHA